MTTDRSFSLALQDFLFFLTSHLTAYSRRLFKFERKIKQSMEIDRHKKPENKKGPVLPKETFRFFISGHGKQREAIFSRMRLNSI